MEILFVWFRLYLLVALLGFAVRVDCDNLYKRFSFTTFTDSGTREIVERVSRQGSGIVPFVLQSMIARVPELEEVSLEASRGDDEVSTAPRRFPLEMWIVKDLGERAIPALARELTNQRGSGKAAIGYRWVLSSLLLNGTKKTPMPLGSLASNDPERLRSVLGRYSVASCSPIEWSKALDYVDSVLHLDNELLPFFRGAFWVPIGRQGLK